MVLVSVIMPAYNHGIFLAEVIESVLNQTFINFEFIIIDDKSSDNSVEIIRDYGNKDKRIKFFIHNENIGAIRTMNECIEMAKGKYIAFLNSDDVWVEKKLEKQLEIFQINENLIVWTEGEIIDSNSKPQGKLFTQRWYNLEKKSGNILFELIHGNFSIFFSSLMLKRENLGNIRFDKRLKLMADLPFEIELAKRYHYHFIKEPLAKYRLHEKNTFRTTNKKKLAKDILIANIEILKKYGHEIPKKLKLLKYQEIIYILFELEKEKSVRAFILYILKANPFKILNYFFLMKSFVKSTYFSNIFTKIQKILNIYIKS